MDISLWKRNFNISFGKLFEYHKIKIASNPATRCLADVNPDQQFKIDGVVGIFHKTHRRSMGFFHLRFILRSRQQDFFNLARICGAWKRLTKTGSSACGG